MKPILTILLFCGVCNITYTQSKDRKYYADMSKTIGFSYGIELNNNYIQKFIPELSAKAKLAQLDFKEAHGEAIEAIENELAEFQDITTTELKSQYTKPIISQIDSNNFTYSESSKYLETFNEDIIFGNNDIFKSFIKTLLRHNPTYRKTPAKEFINNYREIFYSNGHTKSKGLNFSIEYPKSWVSEEGKNPNVLQKFKRGNNFCTTAIAIKDLLHESEVNKTTPTAAELENITSKAYANEMVKDFLTNEFGEESAEKAKLIHIKDFKYDHTTIDDQPTVIVEATGELKKEFIELKVYISIYHIVYNNYSITLTNSIKNTDGHLDTEIEKYKHLFKLMASNLKITDKR